MKNKMAIFLPILLIFINLNGQNKGVVFETKSWKDVLAMAKKQKKDIFIDFYATWCGPCKKMENEVYSDPIVGKYTNERFVSIKVQLDSTSKDNNQVIAWRKTGKELKSKYSITALPTLLFLSSDGELLYKSIGFKDTNQFLKLLNEAESPANQYPTKISSYKTGKLDIKQYPEIMIIAEKYGDPQLYHRLGAEYKSKYLDKLPIEELLNKENSRFLFSNIDFIDSQDRFFYYCYNHPERIDSAFRNRIPYIVDLIITRDEIANKLYNGNIAVVVKPNWEELYNNITSKYNKSFADRLIPNQKLYFYQNVGDWKEYAKLINEKITSHPLTPGNGKESWDLNDIAWNIFLNCNDKNILMRALNWSDLTIKNVGDTFPDVHNFYDTKGNILYKLGKKKEAIIEENKAILFAQTFKSGSYNEYLETRTKMENGIQTW